MPHAPKSTPQPGSWAARAGLVVVLSGCQDRAEPIGQSELPGESATHGAIDADDADDADDPLAALRAIGYADWDEDAEPELSGVTVNDPRAAPGYHLWTNGFDEAYLTDLSGRAVHTWQLPYEQAGSGEVELLEDLEICSIHEGLGLITRIARGSEVIWRHALPVHHEVARGANGELYALVHGRVRNHQGRRVRFGGLVRMDAEGEVLERWQSWRAREALFSLHAPSMLDVPPHETNEQVFYYYHLNRLQVLPDTELGRDDARFRAGNLLLCFRNTHLIAILDAETLEVTWHWGPGELDMPHMPTLLDNGNVLVFDNGYSRGHSRVIELDPLTKEIAWTYAGDPLESFFSKTRGSCQRLPNGNTLICESERGHAFEVTPTGEIVWEFWNPDVVDGRRMRIYRMLRVTPERVEPLLAR